MKIKGLDGKEYSWNLKGYEPSNNDLIKRSDYHLRARELLKNLFPLDKRLEEIPLPGTKGLTADFFIPTRNLLVEVQGEQHYKFIMHFHNNKLGFMQSLKRDNQKKEWCFINSVRLVELPFNETENEWKKRII